MTVSGEVLVSVDIWTSGTVPYLLSISQWHRYLHCGMKSVGGVQHVEYGAPTCACLDIESSGQCCRKSQWSMRIQSLMHKNICMFQVLHVVHEHYTSHSIVLIVACDPLQTMQSTNKSLFLIFQLENFSIFTKVHVFIVCKLICICHAQSLWRSCVFVLFLQCSVHVHVGQIHN